MIRTCLVQEIPFDLTHRGFGYVRLEHSLHESLIDKKTSDPRQFESSQKQWGWSDGDSRPLEPKLGEVEHYSIENNIL